ncbi:MAG: low temperature requirement protein A [Eubacterium sp.]|nr:low temperature requirement protein A [Eubacterium sp.]
MFEVQNGEKKVEYLELIYDLIFVYLIGRNSSLIQHVERGFVRPELFVTYILCTLIVIQIWSYTTFYINRYSSNTIIEHICLFINMYLLYYMADGTRVNWHSYFYRYNTAWGLILISITCLYLQKLRQTPGESYWEIVHIKGNIYLLLIETGIILISLPVYALTGFPLSPFAMVTGIIGTFILASVNKLVPVDFAHLSERTMLYVVFTFGEMIIAISSYFHGDFDLNMVYFSMMAFLIVVGLFLSYGLLYDKLIDREMNTGGTGYMLIHVLLILSLSNTTVALEFMREPDVAILPKTIFLICSMMLYYIALLAAGRYGKKRLKLTRKCFLILGTEFGGFAVLMFFFRKEMYVNIALSVVFVFSVFGYLYCFWRKMVNEREVKDE